MGKPGNGAELADVSLSLVVLLELECLDSSNGALCWALGTRLQINSSLATSTDGVLLALPVLFKLWRERRCFRVVKEMDDVAIIQDLGR
jgi:hypothetical protein